MWKIAEEGTTGFVCFVFCRTSIMPTSASILCVGVGVGVGVCGCCWKVD